MCFLERLYLEFKKKFFLSMKHGPDMTLVVETKLNGFCLIWCKEINGI